MSLNTAAATLRVGKSVLLQPTSLTLKGGEITAICGPNGAGKTSLLRLLSADVRPSSGGVSLNGRELSQWRAQDRAQTLAVLPQHSSLNFAFAVEDVVALGRSPHASGRQRDQQIVSAALAAVDSGHLRGRCYTDLSGGEQQRVHLARVLAQIWQPSAHGERYLLLDEPTASLDLAHQALLLDVVKGFAAEGVGVCLVVHDLNLAARCADRLLLMRAGEVVASGPPAEVLTVAAVKAVFDVDVQLLAHPQSGAPLVIQNESDKKLR
ncbi:MAG: heme ABC transporter ATP-binding protein [Gammaproteobacteria bacterium]|nr:heme ABC transporter ATP-binding protein [Gammaproteobacteria bacterium]MBQ0841146.1 heme ABC transporter ATP-binding protein [Gammaproteobacteria bacterium]